MVKVAMTIRIRRSIPANQLNLTNIELGFNGDLQYSSKKESEPVTIDEQERRIRILGNARREIEDSLVVMAHLEKAQSESIKEMASRTASLEQERERQRQLNRETDQCISDLVSAIGTFLASGGMLLRSS